jgi:hypothetical protein
VFFWFYAAVSILSTTLNFADLALGFTPISAGLAVTGFLVTGIISFCLPHRHSGTPDGQTQRPENFLKIFLTIPSSIEW